MDCLCSCHRPTEPMHTATTLLHGYLRKATQAVMKSSLSLAACFCNLCIIHRCDNRVNKHPQGQFLHLSLLLSLCSPHVQLSCSHLKGADFAFHPAPHSPVSSGFAELLQLEVQRDLPHHTFVQGLKSPSIRDYLVRAACIAVKTSLTSFPLIFSTGTSAHFRLSAGSPSWKFIIMFQMVHFQSAQAGPEQCVLEVCWGL